MDRAALAARIQEILNNRSARTSVPAPAPAASPSRLLDALGATILDSAHGPCVVIDRHYPSAARHGHHRVERYLSAVRSSMAALPWFLDAREPAGAALAGATGPRLVCFDVETTGLSGGAGTYAFLVGFGYFDDDGFRTRQFFLRGYGEERALLHAVQQELAPGDSAPPPVLVTYNGRAFDVPLIDTRYQMHHLKPPFGRLPHVDMLFPSRRLWKGRGTRDGRPTAIADGHGQHEDAPSRQPVAIGLDESAPGSCALTAIERDILGVRRQDDVPGWEIPSRYFAYTRTGDAAGLAAVLEHNRLDLVSLGAVAAIVLETAAAGADAARACHEHLAAGRLLESLGRLDEAERCFEAAAAAGGAPGSLDLTARAEALYRLAVRRRRARRFDAAAQAWLHLARLPGLDAGLRREALEALAVHHEHREKDLGRAREFALSALQLAGDARRADEVRHRLDRLARKIGGRPERPTRR